MAASLTIPASTTLPSGEIVAVNVPPDEYLARYAETRHEWVKGIVIRMAPVSLQHDALTAYLRHLLAAYLDLRPIGRVLGGPFLMRLEEVESFREPDLQVILRGNPG